MDRQERAFFDALTKDRSGSADMLEKPSLRGIKRSVLKSTPIRRAGDRLFIIMPDDDTEGIANLRLVKRVEDLIRNTDDRKEFSARDLETIMFGDPHYLENNAFSTTHQSVNVYGLPEKRYEVRTEDNAVDVQIRIELQQER